MHLYTYINNLVTLVSLWNMQTKCWRQCRYSPNIHCVSNSAKVYRAKRSRHVPGG